MFCEFAGYGWPEDARPKGSANAARCSQTKATSLQLAGVVGAAIAGIALLGLGTKYALEAHPFWTRETANAEVVAEIQRANHWSILSQAASARGKSQLLYSATRFRYKFRELLLTNGASAEVLSSLFPDLTLLEQVKAKLNSCCQDIEQFMEAEALGERASRDFSTCSFKVVQRDWLSIVDQTSPYVEENARTDAVNLYAFQIEAKRVIQRVWPACFFFKQLQNFWARQVDDLCSSFKYLEAGSSMPPRICSHRHPIERR